MKKVKGLELKRTPRGEKIYRGAFEYMRGETVYSEEEFEVFKDSKEHSMTYFSIMHTRVSTGEILRIYVDYTVSKDYIPQKVLIERTLGKQAVTEIYDFDKKKNTIDYFFISKAGQEHHQISTNPKFHITTPTSATSMLFVKSKKEDTTAKNYYTIFGSVNQWKYVEAPAAQSLALERVGLGTENIKLGDATVPATIYKLFEDAYDRADDDANQPYIRVFLSKHSAIPYMLASEDDGLEVRIKYLNDLNKD